ncbi:MAG: hypothetical protein MR902_04510 [Campylobacter sp.]|nr:hypothetical protein [Campylobacter sp.]
MIGQIDRVKFKLYLSARSKMDDSLGVVSKLDEIRDISAKKGISLENDFIEEIEFLGFRDSLYIYSMSVSFKIYRMKNA